MKNLNEKRPSGLALLPFAMFIVIYMGAGIYYQVKGMEMAFYQFPSVTAMFLAVLAAFIMFKGTINEKFDTFAKGAANVDILTMLMIYILAGAFANVAAVMGGRESTVNLGLSLVPVEFLAAGLFVISAFMGTATGSKTDEILEKINELEEISKEKSSRKTKWEKVKPIIAFALDKGADVAIAILSLVMQMKLGM